MSNNTALENATRDGGWHKKPPEEVRSVDDAMLRAERDRADLPRVVQVYASDWDRVILADEVYRLNAIIRGHHR